MNFEREFPGPNYGYLLELYDRYRANPEAVDESTRRLFRQWSPPSTAPALTIEAGIDLRKVAGVVNAAQAIRSRGYLAARLDPLSDRPTAIDPSLTLEFHDLTADDLAQLPASLARLPSGAAAEDAAQALSFLRSIYCDSIGYDYGHIRNAEERNWLLQAAETGRFRPPMQAEHQTRLLNRLSQVEAFELFINRIYPGKTRFSIEGLDMLVPMLDELIGEAARQNVRVALIGMAHRGRLNVLAHILQKPYEQILAEFRDPKDRSRTWDELGWTGDVKYHAGAYKSLSEAGHVELMVRMPANPSHLELIDPVVQGMSRAANSKVDEPGAPILLESESLPILIHGDASFIGQGIVAETLNLSQLAAYSTGGSLHIIANNQLGFTAIERESRSSLHASDLAKGFEIPVVHVNADEPEACFEAAYTAMAYRQKFHKDFVIDLIGYRRHGHNEGDEPRFTQPLMYREIDALSSVRKLWADKLERDGTLQADEAERTLQKYLNDLQEINQKLDAERMLQEPLPTPPPPKAAQKTYTAVPLERLRELNAALRAFPDSFQPNSKLARAAEKHLQILNDPDAPSVDWAAAEELAFASILEEGIAIRMTGQDTARGTFSQRHAVFYDAETNQSYTPLQVIPQAKASFEIHNTPVSEAGPVGFEIGYNIQAPERFVLWEAQYGDFANNIQTVADELLFSGRAKWGWTPSLALLLPHGNEGMGPDHSSARIERFLDLAAAGNMRVAIPTTAAQYFHLLRRQALLLKTDPLPLVIFTPKGFLRHPLSASAPKQLAQSGWQPLLEEAVPKRKDKAVKTLILCSGRVYFDLVGDEGWTDSGKTTALVKLEQLYPFPLQTLEELLSRFTMLEKVVWLQEEPLNMGAWDFIRPRLRQLLGERAPLYYVGRPESSSPAEGSSTLYRINQKALIQRALNIEERAHIQSVSIERG
ncbi:MAG: 2-oxoglutarate dehydrogenase E1 component [Anaerolineaceae bacterium]|jgi:2-oxoglutarate dehydrogenase E1 component|nr:2-oxoglutarate dehydrogenase E1 component [Anaerolineaceae bacterium]OQY88921.1 MAG: 2-oxoglutarate dehydrogenase E1 component [Anaerolineae bacterium UTCFX1]